MNRDLLEKPFETSLIKTRQGSFGRTLKFVETIEYIRRLNAAFESDWSFEIVDHHMLDNEVVVLGKLVAGGVEKSAFGGSLITKSKESGKPVSLADDLKSATSDALKKACSLLGIGIHLYSASRSSGEQDGRKQSGNGNGCSNGDRLTDKQLGAIRGMGRKLGLSDSQICQHSKAAFNAIPEQLDRREASALIGEFSEALNGRRGVA